MTQQAPIYFDNNATSTVDPRVAEAMAPFYKEKFANPSSGHVFGKLAKEGLSWAREEVALLLGCDAKEVLFTGGASEANNLCIKGTCFSELKKDRAKRLHYIRSEVEHASVKKSIAFLTEFFQVEEDVIPVDNKCFVSIDRLKQLLRANSFFVSCVAAQNEVGTLEPISEIVPIIRKLSPNALIHVDGSQAAGKIPFRVRELGVDLAVIAAQKFHGPKGVGAAYIRSGVSVEPLVHGVGHESGLRAGTENVAGIVGLGKACELARKELDEATQKILKLRNLLLHLLRNEFSSLELNGDSEKHLPNTLNVSFPNIDSSTLLQRVGDKIAASNGAACHWGVNEPSSVLLSMGKRRESALGAVRFSLSKFNTEEEVRRAVTILAEGIKALR